LPPSSVHVSRRQLHGLRQSCRGDSEKMRLGRQYSDPRRAGKPGRQPVDRGRTPPRCSGRYWLPTRAVVSLATSWVSCPAGAGGERFGLSEALLGIVAALAADAPEITASITALKSAREGDCAGVVIAQMFQPGSPSRTRSCCRRLHRPPSRVVLLGGPCLWVAVLCMPQSRRAESSGEPWRRPRSDHPYLVVLA